MSFVRWGQDQSDVYVYAGELVGTGPVLVCCGCAVFAPTAADMLAHLQRHTDAGDTVPAYLAPVLADWRPDITDAELLALEDKVRGLRK
jgi:hypothetical protein